MEDWNDLRLFLEVARQGSLSGAARALGVNHSTVSRRLAALEERLDARLFDRDAGGYTPTAAGADLAETAGRMESQVSAFDRRLLGRDARLSGTLRVASAEIVAPILTPDLAAFRWQHPGIELEVIADNAFANLTRREADVAIRATRSPPEHLVGRRVARAAMALYASHAYLDRHPDTDDLGSHVFIGWDESRRDASSSAWLRRHHPNAAVPYRVNSPAYMLEAAKAGMGLCFLACFRGDLEPCLRRVRPPIDEFGISLWLLTHEDLKATARVRAFLDFMADRIADQRDLLEGRRPQPAEP